MASSISAVPWRQRSSRAFIISALITAALMVIAALVFTLSQGTRRITYHSQALHQADEALVVANAARFQLGFAVHLAAMDREYGSNFAEARQESMGQAREFFAAVEPRLAELRQAGGDVTAEVKAAAGEFVRTGTEILDLLESGDTAAAQEIAEERLESTYVGFTDLILAERDLQFELVAQSDAFMARLGDLARFVLALMIPLAIIFIYREMVRRQQRQAELEIRLDAERQLGKAREDFIANASHELRTPLTSIQGFGQLLESDLTISQTAREMVQMINSETADLNRMVEDLLTTARLAAGQLRFEPEEIDTEEEALVIVSPFVQKGGVIASHIEPAIVHADRLRQRQVIRNLLSNATKYGGPNIRLQGSRHGNWYVWIVADDGDGVPEELEDRLFQRFIHQQGFQQPIAGGVGLGLSIVKSLAEGMGGSVTYERVHGETQFQVKVPLAVQALVGAGIGENLRDVRATATYPEGST